MHLTIGRRTSRDSDPLDQPVDLVVCGRLDAESGAGLEDEVADPFSAGDNLDRADPLRFLFDATGRRTRPEAALAGPFDEPPP